LPPALAAATLSFVLAGALPPETSAQEKIPVPGSDRWRVRYADGTVTINDFCPVAQRRIGERQTPIYVNGRPVGFC
jgi:hypothetical protein